MECHVLQESATMHWHEMSPFQISHSGNGLLYMASSSFSNISVRGDSLAYLEIQMILAIFLTNFDMELFEAYEKSIKWLDHGIASNASDVKVLDKPITI